MAIAKIVYKESAEATPVVWMDTTDKTAAAGNMLSGTTALKNDGTTATGNIATKTSANLSASGATVTAPAGYYASDASKSVATGTAGTPTASKGTVSNHAVSVTPSVTNTEGYISGGTKIGTAVSVSASELVSGTKSITASGTTDVTNYASVSVAAGSATTPAASITTNPTVSVTIGPGKNLLNDVRGGSTSSQVSFIPQSDGGMLISGTATSLNQYNFYTDYTIMNLPAGSYRFLLTGSGTGFSNASIQLYTDTGSGLASRNYGKDFTYTIPSTATASVVRLRCAVDTYDCTVYPMVMDSSNTDTTWEAYTIQVKATGSVSASQNVTPTVSAGYVSSGTAGVVSVSGSGSATQQLSTQAATTITPTTSSQTAVAAGKYTAGAITVAAIPSQYIIPSGTVSITDNGTVDVSQYASAEVSVSGGGGLEYEEGTFTPSEDVAKPTIYFSNTHTSRPFSITIADVGATTPDASSAVVWNFVSYYDVFGSPYNISGNLYYAIIPYRYKTSSSDSSSSFRINTLSNTGTNVCFQYWVSESAFYPEGNNSTYRSGRTYKWIAVWAPTT